MYVSRVGPPPYSQAVSDSFYASQNPCTRSTSVCCLNGLLSGYYVGGPLTSDVTAAIGTCGESVANMQTLGLLDPLNAPAYVDGVLSQFPNSKIRRVGPGTVQLRIAMDDLKGNFSIREDLIPSVTTGAAGTGYRLRFFVGMAYLTLLPANAISTVASQTQITVVITNGLTFSFASQQDYTFIKYITMAVFQNKWVDSLLVERQMQFVRVSIVLPTGLLQNMNTGLIPLGSIRFSIGTSLPDQQDLSKWTNPCYSQDGLGMWDPSQPWREMYASSADQTCATQHNMCSNPVTALLSSNLIQFFFPIGDGAIGPSQFSSQTQYHLYVYFDVSAVDSSSGRVVTTRLEPCCTTD
jgi:hypothetical protein